VPISPKYFAGFRSLGSEVSTEKRPRSPRGSRTSKTRPSARGPRQDKEDLMERLRDLGYM